MGYCLLFRYPDPPDAVSFIEALKAKSKSSHADRNGKRPASAAGFSTAAKDDRTKVCVLAPEKGTGLFVPGKVKGYSHKTGEFKVLLIGETNAVNCVRISPVTLACLFACVRACLWLWLRLWLCGCSQS